MIFDTKEIIIGGTEWKTAPFRFSKMFTLGGGSGGSYIDVLLSGVSPLALTNALGLNYIKALGATEQRNIPSEYTQVEYLESSGEQWIDTGFIPNNGMILDVKTQAINKQMIIGSIDTNANTSRNLVSYAVNGYSPQKLDNYNNKYTDSGINPVIIYLDTTGTKFYCTINNNEVVNTTTGTLTNQTVTVKLSYSDYSGSARSGRYYYAKIYNSNSELVRDLIPARRNSDNVLGMYDTVTGNFLTNQGTGTFTAGSDVTTPSPDNPMDIICNNGVLKYGVIGKNLFDSSEFNTDVGQNITWLHYRIPNGTYTMSTNFPPQPGQVYTNVWILAGNVTSGQDSTINGVSLGHSKTITVTDGWYSVAYRSGIPVIPRNPKDYNWQLEQGSTATPYEPYQTGIYADGTQETVNIIGKNLFDVNNVDIQSNTAISADGSLVSNSAVDTCITYIPVKPNTTYTISGDILGTDTSFFRLAQYKADKTFISRSEDSTGQRSSYTFTTGANTYYIRFHYIKSASLNTYQLELGSTATTYEPYTVLGTANAEMLLKVGDYKDNHELLTGNVTRNVGIKVLDGTENWAYDSTYTRFRINSLADDFNSFGIRLTPFTSTHFIAISDGRSISSVPNNAFYSGAPSGTEQKAIYIKTTDYTTVEQFKAYLADQYANGTPVIVVYPLATPTTETVTGQSLTASGNCTVTATGSLDNLELELSYKQSI